jgi:dTDP-4-dehydrorhamnose 3,5-epimerase
MIIKPTAIPDICLFEPEVFGDERGFFMETFNAKIFFEALNVSHGMFEFVQDNHSGSRRGTLRGLHYQIQKTQGKLMRVVSGEIFDVAVDIRRSSPTFKQWIGHTLSAQNKLQMWIPEGFAHGYYVLSDWAEIIYKTTDYYAPEWERVLLWNDPEIGIAWPVPVGETLILSARDMQGVPLRLAELFE